METIANFGSYLEARKINEPVYGQTRTSDRMLTVVLGLENQYSREYNSGGTITTG